jgi:hypothetical protein
MFPRSPHSTGDLSTLEVVMAPRVHVLVFLGLLVTFSAGCSFSDSSETISDSLVSPFRWSSDSSPDGGDDFAYARDLSDYASIFAKSGGDLEAFRTAVRLRAEAEGISNWEEDAFTCASIGYGLQLAQVDPAQASRFGEELLGAHPKGLAALRSGYATVQ